MGVVATRETTGRALSHTFGDSPTAERKFIVTLDSTNTGTQEIINAVGIGHLAPHPEYGYLRMTNATATEATPTPFHAEVTLSYSVPEGEEADPNPLNRPDVWSFSTSGAAVPAYYFYEGNGNTEKVLVNSANDFFEGATVDESEVRATIQKNIANFPLGLAANVTNRINSDTYLGAPPHHWKCGGISANQTTEIVNEAEIRYWQVTIELMYRQSGWPLLLPDVGYNCMEGGEKIRAFVLDPDPENRSTRIPCASPVALNADGTIKAGAPNILVRRVHKTVAFQGLFGTPPP